VTVTLIETTSIADRNDGCPAGAGACWASVRSDAAEATASETNNSTRIFMGTIAV
jgi:hypothetical protein